MLGSLLRICLVPYAEIVLLTCFVPYYGHAWFLTMDMLGSLCWDSSTEMLGSLLRICLVPYDEIVLQKCLVPLYSYARFLMLRWLQRNAWFLLQICSVPSAEIVLQKCWVPYAENCSTKLPGSLQQICLVPYAEIVLRNAWLLMMRCKGVREVLTFGSQRVCSLRCKLN
jgi:hypothetical protein